MSIFLRSFVPVKLKLKMLHTKLKPWKGMLLLFLSGAVACTKAEMAKEVPTPGFVKGDVGFYIDSYGTKTALSENGRSVEWMQGDKLYVWARNQKDSSVLINQGFGLFAGNHLSKAYFTSTLANAMEQGEYKYVACYPAPTSFDSTTVSFKLPQVQNGEFNGIDFMMSDVTTGSALKPMEKVEDYSSLNFNFSHKFHILRFYIPEDHTGAADGIQAFDARMPVPVVGTYVTDIYDQEDGSYISDTDSRNTLVMKLSTTLLPEKDGKRPYAYAAIIPFQSKADDKLYFFADTINSKTSFNTIALEGRDFQAGHMTSVAIRPTITDSRDICITYTGNQSGEPVKSLRLIGPDGLVWKESGSNVLDIEAPGDTLEFQSSFTPKYSISKEIFTSDKLEIIAEMRTEHLGNRNLLTLSELGNLHHTADIAAKVLLAEDFSTVNSFSQGDSGSGNNNSIKFLEGWTGSRIGASEGKSIRIAARRTWSVTLFGLLKTETLAPARADSAPLGATIIKDCKLEVSFTYGSEFEGTKLVDQNFQVGYTTNMNALASGSTEGTYQWNKVIEKTTNDGSYDETPNQGKVILSDLPLETPLRISFKTTPLSDKTANSSNNTTTRVYIDNVSVKIADAEEEGPEEEENPEEEEEEQEQEQEEEEE